MKAEKSITAGEIIKAFFALVLILSILAGAIFIADCNQCIYTGKEQYCSPDGDHAVTIRVSSPHPYTMDTYKIKVTAANDGWLVNTLAVSRKYSGVLCWSVEWKDDDTALLTLSTVSYVKTLTIDFSDDTPRFSE